MDSTSYIALSREIALQDRLAVIAQNLANVDTSGYKRQMLRVETVWEPDGDHGKLAFVQDVGRYRDFAPGALRSTGNPLDFAIGGRGYFAVQTPDGNRYTRDGHFRVDTEGRLVTSTGYPVLDSDGTPITLTNGGGSIELASDGTLSDGSGPIARLGVFDFADPGSLEAVGENLYRTDQPPQPVDTPQLAQGMIEESNVEPVLEITRMIETVRAFEATQKMLDTHHELERRAIQRVLASAA